MKNNGGGLNRIPLEDTKVGFWTVLEYRTHGYYRCRCECGKEKVIRGRDLGNGSSSSCGCMARKIREEQRVRMAQAAKPFVPMPKYE